MNQDSERKMSPQWDIVNPETGEVDLVGAMRHVITALHNCGAVREDIHSFVTCPLKETLEGAGIDTSKSIPLCQLMQELGLVRRTGKRDTKGTYRWWVIDLSFLDMRLHPDLIESAKKRYEKNRKLHIKLNKLNRSASQPTVHDDAGGKDTMDQVAEMFVDIDNKQRHIDELGVRVADLEKQLAAKVSPDEALATAIAAARKRMSGAG